MKTPLILTFDVGTQSTRCLLVRPDGSFADLCQVKHDPPYRSRNPGWAEQDPDFYYQRICETGRAVCQRSGELLGDIAAVALTTIRDTVLCLDGGNRPLRDAILWLDKRRAQFDDPIPLPDPVRSVRLARQTHPDPRGQRCGGGHGRLPGPGDLSRLR